MTEPSQTPTALQIRAMARQHHVVFVQGRSDTLAHHITRLAGDSVEPDEIEQLLFALVRSKHMTREEMYQWQARYLREITP